MLHKHRLLFIHGYDMDYWEATSLSQFLQYPPTNSRVVNAGPVVFVRTYGITADKFYLPIHGSWSVYLSQSLGKVLLINFNTTELRRVETTFFNSCYSDVTFSSVYHFWFGLFWIVDRSLVWILRQVTQLRSTGYTLNHIVFGFILQSKRPLLAIVYITYLWQHICGSSRYFCIA